MRKKYISLLLASTLLCSCAMIPEYKQPDTQVEATWQDSSSDKSVEKKDQNILAPNIAWQDFFQSPELQQVIKLALTNNKDLRTALLNVEKSRAQYDIQKADLLPKLNADAGGTFGDNGSIGPNQQDIYSAGLAVPAYELDLFGRVQSLSKAALNSYLATSEARKTVQLALIAEAANSYLKLISDQENLDLSRHTLEAQESSYKLINKSYQYGVATKLDVAQVRIAVETARSSKELYKRLVQQDKNALVALLGIKNLNTMSIEKELNGVALLSDIPVGLPAAVLLQRPDIKQAEYTLRGAGANIGAARAAFFPRITLTGNLGYQSNDLSDLFNGGSGSWGFIPSISVPIFNAGQNQANLEVAQVEQKIAVTQYQKAVQNAFREVADQLAGRDTLGNQLDAQRMLVEASQDAYDLSMSRYNQGIDNFLSVLDSQRSLFAAQQREIDIHRDMLANKVSLYKVLGGGLLSKTGADEES